MATAIPELKYEYTLLKCLWVWGLISEKSKVRANLINNTYKDFEREIEENTDEFSDEAYENAEVMLNELLGRDKN